MFLVEIFKGIFYSGEPKGTSDKNKAVLFADKSSAEKYAKDTDGKVVEKKRGK